MSTIKASDVKQLREKTGVGMMDCKKALLQTNGNFDEAIKYLREKGLSSAIKKSERDAHEGSIFIAISEDLKKGVILTLNCETDFVASNHDFKAFGDLLVTTCLDHGITNKEALGSLDFEGTSFQDSIAALVLKLGENINVGQFSNIESSGALYSYIHSNSKIGVLLDLSQVADVIGKDIAMHVAATNPLYIDPSDVPSQDLENEKDIIRTQSLNQGRPEKVIDKIVEGKIAKYFQDVCLIEQDFIKDSDNKIKDLLKDGLRINSFIRFSFS